MTRVLNGIDLAFEFDLTKSVPRPKVRIPLTGRDLEIPPRTSHVKSQGAEVSEV